MRGLCEKIAEYIYYKGIIQYEDVNAFRFALELMITQVLTFVSIFILGITIRNFNETLIYCIYFIWTRRIVEGYHARTFLNCYILTMIFSLIIFLLASININYIYLNIVSFIISLVYLKNHVEDVIKIFICLLTVGISIFVFDYYNFISLVNLISILLFGVLIISDLGGKEYGNSNC